MLGTLRHHGTRISGDLGTELLCRFECLSAISTWCDFDEQSEKWLKLEGTIGLSASMSQPLRFPDKETES